MRAPIKALPSVEYLRECFAYDPDVGKLRWKVRPISHFVTDNVQTSWNSRFAGKRVGTVGSRGYRRTMLTGFNRLVHRIVFKLMTGKEPPPTLDHADGNRDNNLWLNIRPATYQGSVHNRGVLRSNTSGYRGVQLRAGPFRIKKWRARIRTKNGNRHLGLFSTVEEASAAYEAAACKLHGEFYRTLE